MRFSLRRPPRPSFRPGAALLSGLALTAGAALGGLGQADGPGATVTADPELVGCIGACAKPTNAAKVYRWGLEHWHDEFERNPLRRDWRSNRPKLVNTQHGMLTLWGNRDTRSVTAWPTSQRARYGRWEARVRAVQMTTGHSRFRFNWELVPTGDYRCGARNIVLASYKPEDQRAQGAVRTLPRTQFTFSKKLDLRSRAWHTYAVEVTKNRISWFVDTKVIRTERRDAALSGVEYKPRFRITGVPGARMNESRMQMDWVRYYTLKRPNARSVEAPQMTRSRYGNAC